MVYDLFDGSTNIRHYERHSVYARQCELLPSTITTNTVTHLLFEVVTHLVFIIKDM